MAYRGGTKLVAKMFGVRPGTLIRIIWEGRLTAPAKGPGSAFLWTDADIERLSWVLRQRDASDILAKLDKAQASQAADAQAVTHAS
jgi:hypothetical protein